MYLGNMATDSDYDKALAELDAAVKDLQAKPSKEKVKVVLEKSKAVNDAA